MYSAGDLSKDHFVRKIGTCFGMAEGKSLTCPIETNYLRLAVKLMDNFKYRRLIGCLLYLATYSLPDIAAYVGNLNAFSGDFALPKLSSGLGKHQIPYDAQCDVCELPYYTDRKKNVKLCDI